MRQHIPGSRFFAQDDFPLHLTGRKASFLAFFQIKPGQMHPFVRDGSLWSVGKAIQVSLVRFR
ncbi:hypothetical protein B5P46_06730 [Rhizobium leguminosarum]|uniref:Uncharacterized protein n=1 Tax=Rhizobium leguminosarum TaxID=384 RepID=A0A4Q1UCF6_RHILE|nr:hypothetical protein B5P46_06730 [Rhizobium leguminosarum]